MRAKPLHLLLTLALWLVLTLVLLSAVFALALPLLDEQLLTSWQVQQAETSRASINLTGSETNLRLQIAKGELLLETSAFSLALSRALTILLLGGMVGAIIYFLRQLVADVTCGRPFSRRSASALQKAGYLLVTLPVVLYLEVFARFYLFIPGASQNSEFNFSHIRLLTGNGNDLLIYPGFNAGLLLAGCFVLVMANAFNIGAELQTDSDEII
ncbi:DUF2975 domain-containing protein [Arsukibacterium indicum]|uniref:DUF2975 domain-containing protein n=1 Tax=Arsukibacterium indicum TaxID=2848612 RepID=A0ABS6MNT5_9GAMM|nr:DUF2975 domain-containing protein [Arsukibacterium indicum]MBV2130488.1 DUF2975 domain-containing protein [Arsukibacterium indicum]